MVQAEQWIPIGHYVVDYILGILEWSEHDERTDWNKRGGDGGEGGQHLDIRIGQSWLWSMESRFTGVVAAGVGPAGRLHGGHLSGTGERMSPGATTNSVGVWGLGTTVEGQGDNGVLRQHGSSSSGQATVGWKLSCTYLIFLFGPTFN